MHQTQTQFFQLNTTYIGVVCAVISGFERRRTHTFHHWQGTARSHDGGDSQFSCVSKCRLHNFDFLWTCFDNKLSSSYNKEHVEPVTSGVDEEGPGDQMPQSSRQNI